MQTRPRRAMLADVHERERRRIEQLRADQDVLRAASAWVAAQPAAGTVAALSEPEVAGPCAELLDLCAEDLDTLTPDLRCHVVRVARELTGDPMDQPTRRRTRRRG